MPDNWDRKSRKNVSYASKARLEMIVEYLKYQQEVKKNYIVKWPEIKYELEASGMTFFTQWPVVEPTIFDLRPQNLYLKHTK